MTGSRWENLEERDVFTDSMTARAALSEQLAKQQQPTEVKIFVKQNSEEKKLSE